MDIARFNYYGYDKGTYEDCISLIRTNNWNHVLFNNTWFIFNCVLYLIFSIRGLFDVDTSRVPFYLVFTILAVLLECFLIFFRKISEKYSTIAIYADIVLLMVYSILSSTAQPYMAAVVFPVLLVLVALSYIDMMLRMSFVLIAYGAVFLLSSYSQKAISIAYSDTYNVIIVMTLAVTLHYVFQRVRMNQFILYQNNHKIRRELEVKSSFDALTSLLNRGRFFSAAGDSIRKLGDGDYLVLCLLDLDNFKSINDTLGHQMGDKVIQMAGHSVINTLGIDLTEKWSFIERALEEKSSLAGRLGGDEFIALIRGSKNRDEAVALMNRMLQDLNSVKLDGLDGIHASFGATELSRDDDIDSAYKRADDALYESKRAGKNQIHFL
ncbi:MAG: GGDEF domain-containing protein [Lachnospiraceae bacterium]|nr:GGDEF domain-containing protein [Lachnospiraceae bacterium]